MSRFIQNIKQNNKLVLIGYFAILASMLTGCTTGDQSTTSAESDKAKEGNVAALVDSEEFNVEPTNPTTLTIEPIQQLLMSPITTDKPTPFPSPTKLPTIVPTQLPTLTKAPVTSCKVGQVNINTASLEEVKLIIHIDDVRGPELIQLRPFTSIDQLTKINGIATKRLADIRAQGLACI